MKTVIKWLIESLEAIEKLNNEKIVHNNIRPENIYHSNHKGIILGDALSGIFNIAEKISIESFQLI